MDAAERPPTWPGHVVRLVGLWVLAGALLKLFLAAPADLPRVIHDLPIGALWAYRLAIAIELFVGLLALLRPARAWPLAIFLLGAFLAVLTTQVAAGAHSCGCFGRKVEIPPVAALSIDAAFLLAVLLSRPWRLRRGGIGDLLVASVVLVVACLAPMLVNHEETQPAPWNVKAWVGKRLRDTPIAKWIDVEHALDGRYVLYRTTCPICADCLATMSMFERDREVMLVRLSEPPDPDTPTEVHTLPRGPNFHEIDLPDDVRWDVTAPADFVVKDGVVVSGREGMTEEECRTPP